MKYEDEVAVYRAGTSSKRKDLIKSANPSDGTQVVLVGFKLS